MLAGTLPSPYVLLHDGQPSEVRVSSSFVALISKYDRAVLLVRAILAKRADWQSSKLHVGHASPAENVLSVSITLLQPCRSTVKRMY